MKAKITLPDKTTIEVDATMEELMRLAGQAGYSVFIPCCTCGSTFPCRQHGVTAKSVTVARPFFYADATKPTAKA